MDKKEIILKFNHIVFWWYYKRVPEFFRKWTILKSIKILVDNYEHAEYRYEGLERVVRNAFKNYKSRIKTNGSKSGCFRSVKQNVWC